MKTCRHCHLESPDDAQHCVHNDCFQGRWFGICPPRFRNTDPKRLPNQQALKQVMAYTYSDRGVFAAGPTGQGKTRAIYLLLHRLHAEDRAIIALDCLELSHRISEDYLESIGWLRQLARVSVLFIDDIDKQKLTERVQSELFGVIDRRIANCLPFFITGNPTGQELADKLDPILGPAFIRRLKEFTDLILF